MYSKKGLFFMTLNDFISWHAEHCERFEKKGCARTQARLDRDMDSISCRACFYNHFVLKAKEESISMTDPRILPSGAIPPVFFLKGSEDIDFELADAQMQQLVADIRSGLAQKKYYAGTRFAFVSPVTVGGKTVVSHVVLELVDFDHVTNLEDPAEHSATFRVLMRFYPLCCARSYRGLLMVLLSRTLHMLPHELQRVIVKVRQELYDIDPPSTQSQDGETQMLKGARDTSKSYSFHTYSSKLWVPTASQLGIDISPFTNVEEVIPDPVLDLFNPVLNPDASSMRTMNTIINETRIPMEYWTSSLLMSTDEESPTRIGLGRVPKEGEEFDIVSEYPHKPIPIVPFVTIA